MAIELLFSQEGHEANDLGFFMEVWQKDEYIYPDGGDESWAELMGSELIGMGEGIDLTGENQIVNISE